MAGVLRIEELSAPELDALDRARTAVFLVVSPVEEHGPHLPLGTDIFEADAVARRLARRILAARPGSTALFYPTLPLGSDCFRYPGTVEVRPALVAGVVEDICVSLAAAGFHRFIVSSHHGGPAHNLALDRAARALRRRTRGRAALLSLPGRTIVDLYLRGGLAAFHDVMDDGAAARRDLAVDCHAGAFETSEMLALRPDLVRDFAELEPVLVPLHHLTTDSARTEGRGLGYFGAPAVATRERGERFLDFVVERALPDVRDFLDGKPVPGVALRWRIGIRAMALLGRARALFRRRPPARPAGEACRT